MALQCEVKVAKVSLAVFNLLFWLVGAVLLALGAWIFLDHTKDRLLLLAAPSDMTENALLFMAYALLGLGLGALVAGVLGCCGAVQGSRCLLVSFFGLVLVLVAGSLALAAGALATRVQVLTGLQDRLVDQLPKRYGTQRSGNHSAFSDAVDLAQYKFRCCGAMRYTDYELSRWWNDTNRPGNQVKALVPDTCCTLTNEDVAHSGSPLRVVSRAFGGTVEEPWQHPKPKNSPACQQVDASEEYRHKKGCASALSAWYQREVVILVSATLCSAVFELVGLVLAVCLCRAIAKDIEMEDAPPDEEAAEE